MKILSNIFYLLFIVTCHLKYLVTFQKMEADTEKAIWNEVSTDFDPDEETANFGTRQALESDGNLYEVSKSD